MVRGPPAADIPGFRLLRLCRMTVIGPASFTELPSPTKPRGPSARCSVTDSLGLSAPLQMGENRRREAGWLLDVGEMSCFQHLHLGVGYGCDQGLAVRRRG